MTVYPNPYLDRSSRPCLHALLFVAIGLLAACGRKASETWPVVTYNCAANTPINSPPLV